MKNSNFYLFVIITLLITGNAMANITLPAFFADNMVLQRNTTIKIWGWANPKEEIKLTASWAKDTYTTTGNNEAYWEIEIPTTNAGGPYTINIKGYNQVTLNNVMLGEVWLCSGQSNMEWTPSAGIDNAKAEIAAANYPNIRLFTVGKMSSQYPQLDVKGNWQVCTPETMQYFSAVGYFFAKTLKDELKNVPIGIINSSWGATAAEVWMPAAYIAKDPVLTEAATKIPAESGWCPVKPGYTYNAMIYPLAGYKLAGVLWYQGETNTGSSVYNKTLGGLINAWREAWQDNFPFYYVQIAPFNYEGGSYQGVNVRDAQRRLLNESTNTGMVVISDVSSTDDIHPRNKKPVGERLANLALSEHYKIDKGIVNSPLFKNAEVAGKKITVHFNYADGLYCKSKTSVLFEVAGEDGVFYPATAKIKGNTVIVTSKKVKKPAQVRYAWHNTAQADIFNKANLPASSFTAQIK
ncbi:sialate O-acetylesterase [Flavobacterium salilacus subsp. salilacus]|uniref:sialate O-acetylesterase n=1 Tax=Flavobacterium TaxID=237 RepID=UPI001074BDBF|nr:MULTISPECIES: sialate O-acetylesterase [Flavobacterium]KAF2519564.1 sialate O-acetylesterase [Flavobacterium salilacus subsp. salilacus]MBE1614535.1 sialate O-acetylesterase [Flavobacterium sp. SaA2.13]